MFIEEFLGFVDLCSQVGTSTTIGVIQQHELTVLLADLVFVQGAFSVGLLDTFPILVKYFVANIRKFQDQRGFTTVHPGLESSAPVSRGLHLFYQHQTTSNPPFVECLPHGIHTSLRAAVCNETGTTLSKKRLAHVPAQEAPNRGPSLPRRPL